MKLLIVEDSEPLRKSVAEYLREEGFAVDSAANGEDGLFNALQWEYDALVLDVMVPAPDGFEILRQLRAAGNTTPVLFLTARSALDDRLRGLDSGADDYLVKPFEMAEMVARIRAAIRRSRGAPDPLLQVGALSINTASRACCSKGCPWISRTANTPCSNCWQQTAENLFPATKSKSVSSTKMRTRCQT